MEVPLHGLGGGVLRVLKDQTTTGTLTIPENQLQIESGPGNVSMTIEGAMDDLISVGFSGASLDG